MKKMWLLGGALVAVLAAGVAVAEARGGGFGPGMMGGSGQGIGYGMMGGHLGMMGGHPGMMGGGMMGEPGACPMHGGDPGQTYDPAAMLTHAETMLARHEALVESLESRLGSVTDERVKANLEARIEQQNVLIGWLNARIPVIKALPEDWLTGAITLAEADVAYFSQATATDEGVQEFIANRLIWATERLAALEARQAEAEQES